MIKYQKRQWRTERKTGIFNFSYLLMKDKIKISEEVLKAFTNKECLLLREIYDFILSQNKSIIETQYKDMASFTAGVRRYIEECSSDSDVFGGKEDLFYSVLGKRKGVWGIRKNRGLEMHLETDKKAETNIRLTQSEFRNKMLKQFEKRCVITGIDIPSLLVASHIKPWSKSDKREKMDEDNGLLLSVHMDVLFDKGLISFDSSGNMVYLDNIIKDLLIYNFKNVKQKLDEKYLTKNRLEYLEWHFNYHKKDKWIY